MNLELDRGQLITLLECLHIASHVRSDDQIAELESVLLKCAQASGLDGIVMPGEGTDLTLNNLILRALHEEIEDYDDDIFWTTLAEELAKRDLEFVKSEKDIGAMSDEDYGRVIDGQADRYDAEFEEHGVDHLTLAHPLPLS